ncbi:MAG: hypothetical protein QG614_426 [Patescibacteria group bacterium]|nr:hypothetical protein [Patescibacteria group bacterium]
MITFSPKQRLEQEISTLITFISYGRELYYEKTGFTRSSSKEWYNHWLCKELFNENEYLLQTDLNIQLLYIKLNSYYEIYPKEIRSTNTKLPRNAFAHAHNDEIFKGRVKYNYFLHKVSEDFSKFMYLFYAIDKENKDPITIELDLNEDINYFTNLWKISEEQTSQNIKNNK